MKKLFTALVLVSAALSASARETIQIIYGFSAADNSANYSRTLAEEANKIQDKYNFIFDAKPGAGGTVAARYVANTPNTILSTSSAFFIRASVFPNESYNLSDFTTLMSECTAPMVITSSKYKRWKEVPRDIP